LEHILNAQTGTMDRLVKTATEARQAAFAAQNQTNPEQYGNLVGQAVAGKITDPLNHMLRVAKTLCEQSRHTEAVLKKAEQDKWDILNDIRDPERQVDRWKTRLPWFVLGAVALIVALTVTLPRFSAVNGTTCAVFGGKWVRTTEGNPACVHYQD
jgi:hypothetical protein